MRKALVAAVALAPICLVVGGSPARATDSVTSGVSSPIATATATSGAADDIVITSGGSVTVTGTTPAVTLNSSNSVTSAGAISISGVDGSTAVLLQGGNTGSLSNTGTISNTDNFTATSNSNGLTQEPYANGTLGRYGIRLTGASPLVGSITNAGTITVSGNNAYAISLEAPLTGSLLQNGSVSFIGDNGAGIRSTTAGSISGAFQVLGTISSTGANSSAINLQGAVGGRVSIYSTVVGTAYATATRPTTTTTLKSVQAATNSSGVISQVQQSAAAVIIGGNVGQGIFVGAPPVGTSTATTTDGDGDGIVDGVEGTGSLLNYGSAPALLIGSSSGAATTIGNFVAATSATQAANNYGVIIRGAVSGFGVYDGVTATGLQIGTGSGSVSIAGGVRVVGSVTADSYEANATAIHLYAGANVGTIRNENFIETSVSRSALSTSEIAATASGIVIDSGATLSSLTNIGTIQAAVNGDAKSAVGIRDNGGGLTTVTNEGVISASITPTTTGDATTGTTVALDLSHNTSGIALTQMVNPNPISIRTVTTTSASGTVTTTAVINTATSATATTTATVTTTAAGVTTTTTTTTPTYPQIIGDVLLGSGTNNVQLLGGSVVGALSLGGGANDILTIDNGAIYSGALTNVNASTGATGTGLALTVNNGSLVNTSTSTLNLSSLTVGAKGVLYAAVDPNSSTATLYNVGGTATIASGGQLGIVLKSTLTDTATHTYTIVTAGSLTNNAGDSVVLSQVPYLFVGTATTAANSISVSLRRRTASEIGLTPPEASALNAVNASLGNDAAIQSAFLGQYSRSGFLRLYDQMLPDYAGGVFQLSLAASDAVTRATARVNDIENPSGTRGAWAEEVAFGANRNANSQGAGYQGGGFGFVGGLETGGFGLGAFGITGAFLTGDLRNPHAPGNNLSSFSEGEGGVYWQGQLGGLRADARVGAGYVISSDRRELLLTNASTNAVVLDRFAKGSNNGYSATAHFGVGYQTGQIGWVYFRPQVHGDYYRLQQGSYTERGGGNGFDLSVASATGQQTSAVASLVTGMNFGQAFKVRPELEIGYRDVFTGAAPTTTASFSGGSPFSLAAPQITGGGPIGRIDLKADTDFYELNFEAGAEERAHFTEGDVRISVRVLF